MKNDKADYPEAMSDITEDLKAIQRRVREHLTSDTQRTDAVVFDAETTGMGGAGNLWEVVHADFAR